MGWWLDTFPQNPPYHFFASGGFCWDVLMNSKRRHLTITLCVSHLGQLLENAKVSQRISSFTTLKKTNTQTTFERVAQWTTQILNGIVGMVVQGQGPCLDFSLNPTMRRSFTIALCILLRAPFTECQGLKKKKKDIKGNWKEEQKK